MIYPNTLSATLTDGIAEGLTARITRKTHSSRVSPCGHLGTWHTPVERREPTLYFPTVRAVISHFFCTLYSVSVIFRPINFHVNSFTLSLRLPITSTKYQSQDIVLPKRLFTKAWGKKGLKTSLTFRLSLKMTLPSTIACGNIVRPTLNFN